MNDVGLDMTIDRVDENDNVISTIIRREVFEKRAGFRVIHVFIFDSRGRLLLQKLSPSRQRHPEYWGSSVAGYVFSGEEYHEAAKRRVAQELGVDLRLDRVGKTMMNDEGCNKFITVFESRSEGPFSPDQSHIAELRFIPVEGLLDKQDTGEIKLTPTLVHLLGFRFGVVPIS